MPRRRNDCAALFLKQFRFRNTLRSFSRYPGLVTHVIYPIDLTNFMKKELAFYYQPMIIFWLFSFFIFITLTPTLADSGTYRLRAGDTIEISIDGASEMRQNFVLDLDGQISVPLVGVVKSEGLTIGELRDKLQQILPRDIAVNMVDYSPVYINGDVVKPGEQRFRPNMTVRQAVALAGGYEVMRYHLVDPIIQSADLGADYETLWTEQAREQARLARLKAELNNEDQLGAGPAESPPISNRLQSDIVNNESQQLALWHSNFDKEMASLTRAIKSATDQLAELVESRDKEKEGEAADAEELQRLSAFNKQGDVTSNQVVDARRAMLLSSTRVLQTEERIIQITREREGYVRQIEKFRDEGRSAILKEIEDSQLRLAATNARIAAAADKMVYTSTMRSQLPLSKLGGPSVTIIRGDHGNRSKTEASEDSVLEPGDVIEISIVPKTKLIDTAAPAAAVAPPAPSPAPAAQGAPGLTPPAAAAAAPAVAVAPPAPSPAPAAQGAPGLTPPAAAAAAPAVAVAPPAPSPAPAAPGAPGLTPPPATAAAPAEAVAPPAPSPAPAAPAVRALMPGQAPAKLAPVAPTASPVAVAPSASPTRGLALPPAASAALSQIPANPPAPLGTTSGRPRPVVKAKSNVKHHKTTGDLF